MKALFSETEQRCAIIRIKFRDANWPFVEEKCSKDNAM